MYWRRMSPSALLAATLIAGISIAAGLQNHKFQGVGQDVFDLGPAPSQLVVADAEIEQPRIGLRYKHIGLMGIDVWRNEGHLAVYENHSSYLSYRDLTDDEVESFGLSTPWRYHFPEGLIALVCLAELLLVSLKPHTIRFALGMGGVLAAIAVVFRFEGLTWECAFPALLAGHHLYAGLGALWSEPSDAAPEVPVEPEPRPLRSQAPERPSTVETDPFRAPPHAPPLVMQRAPTAPPAAPVDYRDDAEAPKLLG